MRTAQAAHSIPSTGSATFAANRGSDSDRSWGSIGSVLALGERGREDGSVPGTLDGGFDGVPVGPRLVEPDLDGLADGHAFDGDAGEAFEGSADRADAAAADHAFDGEAEGGFHVRGFWLFVSAFWSTAERRTGGSAAARAVEAAVLGAGAARLFQALAELLPRAVVPHLEVVPRDEIGRRRV